MDFLKNKVLPPKEWLPYKLDLVNQVVTAGQKMASWKNTHVLIPSTCNLIHVFITETE